MYTTDRLYPCRQDGYSKKLTLSIWTGLIVYTLVSFVFELYREFQILYWVGPLLLLFLLGISLFAPYGYIVSESSLKIKRRCGDVQFPRSEIQSVSEVDLSEFGGITRVLGTSGFHGFFGVFKSTKIGEFKMYCTATAPLVKLAMQDQSVVLISPDESIDFVREFKR